MFTSTRAVRPLLIMTLAAASLHAGAVNYTITFFSPSLGSTPTGSFTYDASVPKFSNFIVNWDGLTFDLTASANNPLDTGAGAPTCLGGLTGAAAGFAWLGTACNPSPVSWSADASPTNHATVTASFAFVEQNGNPEISLSGIDGSSAIDTDTGARGTFSFRVTPASSTPEPGTWALMAAGLGVLALRRR